MYWILLIPMTLIIVFFLLKRHKSVSGEKAIMQSLDNYNFHFLDATPAPPKQRRHLMHREERYNVDKTEGAIMDLSFCEEQRVKFHDRNGTEQEAMVKLRFTLFKFREAEWQPPLDSFSKESHLEQSSAPGSKN